MVPCSLQPRSRERGSGPACASYVRCCRQEVVRAAGSGGTGWSGAAPSPLKMQMRGLAAACGGAAGATAFGGAVVAPACVGAVTGGTLQHIWASATFYLSLKVVFLSSFIICDICVTKISSSPIPCHKRSFAMKTFFFVINLMMIILSSLICDAHFLS